MHTDDLGGTIWVVDVEGFDYLNMDAVGVDDANNPMR